MPFLPFPAEFLPKLSEEGGETEDEAADGTLSSIQESDEIGKVCCTYNCIVQV